MPACGHVLCLSDRRCEAPACSEGGHNHVWWRGRTCFCNGRSRNSDLRVQSGGAIITLPRCCFRMASDGMRVCDSHPVSLEKLAGPLAARSAGLRSGLTFALEIERRCSADEILQGRLIDLVAFVNVDGAPGIPVEAGVEQT